MVYRYSYSPDQYQIEDLIEICNIVSESLVVDDPFAGVCGVIYIFDMSGVSFKHILQYTLTVVRKLVAFYDKSLPLRIRNLCYINVPIVAEQLFKMLLPCLSNELRKRVRTRSLEETLQ